MDSNSIFDFILKVIPGILVALVAWKLSVNKYYREKSWERKEKAYSEMVNALYDMIKFHRIQKEDYGNGTGLSDEAEYNLRIDYIKSRSELSKASAVGTFYFPNEITAILNELDNRPGYNRDEGPLFDYHHYEYEEYMKALGQFLELAKKDLRI